jgi:hypothetical protein
MLARGLDAIELEVFLGLVGLLVIGLLVCGLVALLLAWAWRFA